MERTLDKKKLDLRKLEEGFLRSRKEVERQASKLKVASTGPSSLKEAELQGEVDKCMVCFKGCSRKRQDI